MSLLIVSPVPSCPKRLEPQHLRPPPLSTAHVCEDPAAIPTTDIYSDKRQQTVLRKLKDREKHRNRSGNAHSIHEAKQKLRLPCDRAHSNRSTCLPKYECERKIDFPTCADIHRRRSEPVRRVPGSKLSFAVVAPARDCPTPQKRASVRVPRGHADGGGA